MYAPQLENIEAKCAVVYSIESVLCGRNFVKLQTPTRQFDTNPRRLQTQIRQRQTRLTNVSPLMHQSLPLDMNSAAVTSVTCLRGVPLVVAAYVKRVKMLWSAASFSLCYKSLGVSFI